MPVPDLLLRLLAAVAPSGSEGAALRVFREAASAFAEVREDPVGNLLALPPGEGPVVALVAHLDEIGLIVTHVEDDGLVAVGSVGGWRAEVLVGQRVRLLGRGGPVEGIAAARSLRSDRGERKPLEWTDLHVDVGARDGEEARSLLRPGDVGVIASEPVELRDGVVSARALDDRLGAYVVLEAARRAAEARSPVRLAAVATRREESIEGAGPASVALGADRAIVVDVTFATDVPGESARSDGAHPLGSGPAIGRGPALDGALSDRLLEAAEAAGIAHTLEAVRRHTSTDVEAFHFSGGGTATALVSVPLRYMHTPVEVARLDDVEAAVQLLAAFAARPL